MARKSKIDQTELLTLMGEKNPDGKNLTQTEIADRLGVTRVAVNRAIAKLDPALTKVRDVAKFKADKADILAELQMMFMEYITPEKLKRASLSQIIMAIGTMYDKERMERGQSTENVAVMHDVRQIPPDVRKQLEEAQKAYADAMIKESVKKELSNY